VTGCPACSKDNPEGFQFCGFCGAPLTDDAPAVPLEERKVVSVLFCDLVGFTAASEAADPEDVRARLRPYHERVRVELERYGGTVEKFVGDAVMAVFGAPVSHEDDAERAVRAGLRVLEAISELNEADPALALQVRVGINTGEAVVALGARPELGEGLVTGDVVNTASRLQLAAPVNAVVVSEQTHRQTERIFDFEALAPVQAKGKTKPLALFRPVQARARFGLDVIRTGATPLVGRDLEKPLLIGTFERSAKQRSCQLVTVVGEPGVGKSRLCAELLGYIDERPGLVRWRQGRCLPYGEGIAFWALGEIVKAEAGILESDSPADAEGKLDRALPEGDADRVWLKARLAPLAGVGGVPASQNESFTAWRRVLESWAVERETVLVFEDLHWADPTLLSFLEYLADWAGDVPLLILCTARPELYEQHPTFGSNARNAQRINLPPLTDEETAQLISSLLKRAVLPPETQQLLLERAGGNPLYAEEFVRLLADRGRLADGLDVPESVQALIAARLDTLTAERKSLLQDAAVVGKVFWAGALVEMGDREPHDVEIALHELARKELVRPARGSSMAGESEYGFWHVLVRDVCYGQIPRAARAARHRSAAAWLERHAGERAEDLADVLAHHYSSALEFARAAGNGPEAAALEVSAVRYLELAGQRALGLDVASAEHSLSRALSLTPGGHPERARVLEHWAQAALQQNRLTEAKDALEEALASYREQGDSLAAGRVLTVLASVLQRLGDPRQQEAISEALTVLEAQPPGPELVAAHAQLARARAIGSAYHDSIVAAERALALAAELNLPEPVRALSYRGTSRCFSGERQGLEDMRRALELAIGQGHGLDAATTYNNLAMGTWQHEGPQAAFEACREGIEFCQRRGITEFALAIGSLSTTYLADLGQGEQALAEAGPLAERLQAAGNIIGIEPRAQQLRLLAERGSPDEAPAADDLITAARESGEPQVLALAFAGTVRLQLAKGNTVQVHALLLELSQVPGTRTDPYYASLLPDFLRAALALDDSQLAHRLVEGVQAVTPLARHSLAACRAQLAEATGDPADAATLYADAAQGWEKFGNVPERAYALLGQGRCLLALGDASAEAPLTEARDLFASMGYKPALAETEKLLAKTA
jgi:class 3 adenylate cyclase/tetratricopeptide (TPR) repeat protein